MPTLNIADLSLAIIWLFFAIRGYLRGLVKEAGSLAAIVLAFYFAGTYHRTLAPRLSAYISGNYADTAAYLIIFTVTLFGVWFVALAISGIVKITMTDWADRFFGGCFGLIKGMVITSVLLFLLHLAAPHPDFLQGSRLVPVLDRVNARLERYIPTDINEKMRRFSHKDPVEQLQTAKEKAAALAKSLMEQKAAAAKAEAQEKKTPPAPETEKDKQPAASPPTETKPAKPQHGRPQKAPAAEKPAPHAAPTEKHHE